MVILDGLIDIASLGTFILGKAGMTAQCFEAGHERYNFRVLTEGVTYGEGEI
jgi:hypothetical protein